MVQFPAPVPEDERREPLHVVDDADHVVIRGRRIDLARLVNPRLFESAYRSELKAELLAATPFKHLVVDGWFDPVLLELVREEFDSFGHERWRVIQDEHQLFHRSTTHESFGPASQIYFALINAGWFVSLLGELTDHDDLIGDPLLAGGGLHETRTGGKFAVHRDFDKHALYGLENKMVFITYLNRDWNPDWGASLQLWGTEPRECVREIVPELGRSVLLLNGPESFHGHPEPMQCPPGQTRRSVASYYYRNPRAVQERLTRQTSVFLMAYRTRRLRRLVTQWTPPIVLDAIKKILGR